MSTDPTLNCPECQARSPYLDFTVDGMGNDLRANHFRCPVCRYQWAMVATEKTRIYQPDGPGGPTLVFPPKRERRDIEQPTL